jgi:5'-3' exonuclease
MGIKKLKTMVPKVRVKEFGGMFPGHTFRLDAANMMYHAALKHAREFQTGNYVPAARYCQLLLQFYLARGMLLFVVFDGQEDPDKVHETQRRRLKRAGCQARVDASKANSDTPSDSDVAGCLSNQPMFTALLAKVCSFYRIPFSVSPYQADPALNGLQTDEPFVVVSSDTDNLAYGVIKWVSLEHFNTGTGWLVDTDSFDETDFEGYPIARHFMAHGSIVFRLVGAVLGCDATEKASGITGIGQERLIEALNEHGCDKKLTAMSFAEVLVKLKLTSESTLDLAAEIERVNTVFTTSPHAVRYGPDGEHVALDGRVLAHGTETTRAHMSGLLNPRTLEPFSTAEQALLDSYDPSQVTHSSKVDPSSVAGGTLPDIPERCGVDALRSFLTARGATSSGHLRAELVVFVQAYLNMEEEIPPVLFDRSANSGFELKSIPSKHGTLPTAILTALLKDPQIAESKEPFALRPFFELIMAQYAASTMMDSKDSIILNSPELEPWLIQRLYCHLGGGDEKKAMKESFSKFVDQDGVIYHAMGILDGSIIIVSKQRASLVKDESTRKTTGEGEKPLAKEYMSFVELFTRPTTVSDDGHELGIVTGIGRTWCPCCAGRACCVHLGMAIWSHLHHWAPDRPTDKPVTSSFCSWISGSKKRVAEVSGGISSLAFVKVEMDKPDKAFRSCRESNPGGAKYDTLSAEDRALFDAQMKPERMRALCAAIQRRSTTTVPTPP